MADHDPAATRYGMMQLARFAAVALAVAGGAMAAGRWGSSPELGYILLLAGLIAFFAVPVLLARRWKSRDE